MSTKRTGDGGIRRMVEFDCSVINRVRGSLGITFIADKVEEGQHGCFKKKKRSY